MCKLLSFIIVIIYLYFCPQDKVQAARSLVQQLSSTHGELVQSVRWLCEAYIELAYHDASGGGRSRTGVGWYGH